MPKINFINTQVCGFSSALLMLAISLLPQISQAQTDVVVPGKTVTLGPFDYSDCKKQADTVQIILNDEPHSSPEIPKVNCDTSDFANGTINVRAGSDLLVEGTTQDEVVIDLAVGEDPMRQGYATGQIGKTIRILEVGAEETGAEVLTAQISTNVSWSGLLWNRKILLPSWTQVSGSLQVRDLTTGLIVASNTFLDQSVHMENIPPVDFGGLVDFMWGWTSIRGSAGVDLSAQLLRGRDYRVEVEATCQDLLPVPRANFRFKNLFGTFTFRGIFAGGGCFFSGKSEDFITVFPKVAKFNTAKFNPEGGFQVSPITVTVQDDTKAKLSALLNQDDDGDGIPNLEDACPASELSATIMIDDCDAGVDNLLLENGCTLNDEIAKCAATGDNHGQFVSCVSQLSNDRSTLLLDGIDNWKKRGPIQSCAAQAQIP